VAAAEMTDAERADPEIAALRERLIDCEQRLAELPTYEEEARLAVAEREELATLRDRVQALEAELEAVRTRSDKVIEEMKASLSWRLTAPLRGFKRSR
jgi:chromosome segregation ATPase